MVTGTVKQMQFLNPVSWLVLSPLSDEGKLYQIALDSPDALTHGGWPAQSVSAGDRVTVTGAPAIDGSSKMQATSVSANGTVIFTRSSAATK